MRVPVRTSLFSSGHIEARLAPGRLTEHKSAVRTPVRLWLREQEPAHRSGSSISHTNVSQRVAPRRDRVSVLPGAGRVWSGETGGKTCRAGGEPVHGFRRSTSPDPSRLWLFRHR